MKHLASGHGKHQRGFALVAAIFIVVILSLLGIMMVTIGGMQRATASTAAQGTRAYYAARAGIEWGTFQSVSSSGPHSCPAASGTLTLSVPGLNGFTVIVQCTPLPSAGVEHQEYNQPYNVYSLTATATSGNFGDADFVSRTINAIVTDAPAP